HSFGHKDDQEVLHVCPMNLDLSFVKASERNSLSSKTIPVFLIPFKKTYFYLRVFVCILASLASLFQGQYCFCRFMECPVLSMIHLTILDSSHQPLSDPLQQQCFLALEIRKQICHLDVI
ncbi:hypothetical protein STEG23_020832, partial [Scotinomys teguina]